MQPTPQRAADLDAFGRLIDIMDELREKCPWDKKQTLDSLRSLTLEETYELADAITLGDWKGVKEELGDLMLHLVFYSRIGKEQGQFTIAEMIHGICDKLIKRHPHIYGDVQVNNEEDVKRNWEQIKLSEGKKSVLAGVPASLPALVKALRLQEKAKQVGFEWEQTDQVLEKVREEEVELMQAIEQGSGKSRRLSLEICSSPGSIMPVLSEWIPNQHLVEPTRNSSAVSSPWKPWPANEDSNFPG